MNRTRFTYFSSLLVCAVATGWAWAGIEGSKHDFSSKPWSKDDQCGACHTPHKQAPAKAAPLWNPKADLSRTFGTSIQQAKSAGAGTRMCLQCHDGTVAPDAIGGLKRSRFDNKQHPGLFSAGHRSSDHPVGVPYPKSNKYYRPSPTVIAKGTVALPNGNVECISCHDPHNTSGANHMLVVENHRSALCLTCHKK